MIVKQKDQIKVHYVGTLNNGIVFDSSKDRDPLSFVVGEGKLIPGFENAVVGMGIDEVKNIQIPAEEAYGKVYQELIQKVSKDLLPENLNPEVGQALSSKLPDGNTLDVIVTEVGDDSITIDGNHPLAGQDLNFEITLVEIL